MILVIVVYWLDERLEYLYPMLDSAAAPIH